MGIFKMSTAHTEYMRIWRDKNREKVREIVKKSDKKWLKKPGNREKKNQRTRINNARINFGGNKYFVLERDGYKCIICGMTNDEHLLKYGRRITVNHINGDRSNNKMNNLETLCSKCHSSKDGLRVWEKRIRKESVCLICEWCARPFFRRKKRQIFCSLKCACIRNGNIKKGGTYD